MSVHRYDRQASVEQLQELLRAVYQQLLERQPYQWERREYLASIEQEFLQKKMNLRRLIRAVGHSPLYRQLFLQGGGNTRCVEQAFKHFLGRIPLNSAEMASYHQILLKSGFNALIDALLDSDEYRQTFGQDRVPTARNHGIAPLSPYLTRRFHDSHHLFMPQVLHWQF
ncbi:MAG: hypothetical protein OHK0012_16310 [Synechococcales cyanobacterium]